MIVGPFGQAIEGNPEENVMPGALESLKQRVEARSGQPPHSGRFADREADKEKQEIGAIPPFPELGEAGFSYFRYHNPANSGSLRQKRQGNKANTAREATDQTKEQNIADLRQNWSVELLPGNRRNTSCYVLRQNNGLSGRNGTALLRPSFAALEENYSPALQETLDACEILILPTPDEIVGLSLQLERAELERAELARAESARSKGTHKGAHAEQQKLRSQKGKQYLQRGLHKAWAEYAQDMFAVFAFLASKQEPDQFRSGEKLRAYCSEPTIFSLYDHLTVLGSGARPDGESLLPEFRAHRRSDLGLALRELHQHFPQMEFESLHTLRHSDLEPEQQLAVPAENRDLPSGGGSGWDKSPKEEGQHSAKSFRWGAWSLALVLEPAKWLGTDVVCSKLCAYQAGEQPVFVDFELGRRNLLTKKKYHYEESANRQDAGPDTHDFRSAEKQAQKHGQKQNPGRHRLQHWYNWARNLHNKTKESQISHFTEARISSLLGLQPLMLPADRNLPEGLGFCRFRIVGRKRLGRALLQANIAWRKKGWQDFWQQTRSKLTGAKLTGAGAGSRDRYVKPAKYELQGQFAWTHTCMPVLRPAGQKSAVSPQEGGREEIFFLEIRSPALQSTALQYHEELLRASHGIDNGTTGVDTSLVAGKVGRQETGAFVGQCLAVWQQEKALWQNFLSAATDCVQVAGPRQKSFCLVIEREIRHFLSHLGRLEEQVQSGRGFAVAGLTEALGTDKSTDTANDGQSEDGEVPENIRPRVWRKGIHSKPAALKPLSCAADAKCFWTEFFRAGSQSQTFPSILLWNLWAQLEPRLAEKLRHHHKIAGFLRRHEPEFELFLRHLGVQRSWNIRPVLCYSFGASGPSGPQGLGGAQSRAGGERRSRLRTPAGLVSEIWFAIRQSVLHGGEVRGAGAWSSLWRRFYEGKFGSCHWMSLKSVASFYWPDWLARLRLQAGESVISAGLSASLPASVESDFGKLAPDHADYLNHVSDTGSMSDMGHMDDMDGMGVNEHSPARIKAYFRGELRASHRVAGLEQQLRQFQQLCDRETHLTEYLSVWLSKQPAGGRQIPFGAVGAVGKLLVQYLPEVLRSRLTKRNPYADPSPYFLGSAGTRMTAGFKVGFQGPAWRSFWTDVLWLVPKACQHYLVLVADWLRSHFAHNIYALARFVRRRRSQRAELTKTQKLRRSQEQTLRAEKKYQATEQAQQHRAALARRRGEQKATREEHRLGLRRAARERSKIVAGQRRERTMARLHRRQTKQAVHGSRQAEFRQLRFKRRQRRQLVRARWTDHFLTVVNLARPLFQLGRNWAKLYRRNRMMAGAVMSVTAFVVVATLFVPKEVYSDALGFVTGGWQSWREGLSRYSEVSIEELAEESAVAPRSEDASPAGSSPPENTGNAAVAASEQQRANQEGARPEGPARVVPRARDQVRPGEPAGAGEEDNRAGQSAGNSPAEETDRPSQKLGDADFTAEGAEPAGIVPDFAGTPALPGSPISPVSPSPSSPNQASPAKSERAGLSVSPVLPAPSSSDRPNSDGENSGNTAGNSFVPTDSTPREQTGSQGAKTSNESVGSGNRNGDSVIQTEPGRQRPEEGQGNRTNITDLSDGPTEGEQSVPVDNERERDEKEVSAEEDPGKPGPAGKAAPEIVSESENAGQTGSGTDGRGTGKVSDGSETLPVPPNPGENAPNGDIAAPVTDPVTSP
ncbi:hypothetical protein P0082_05240 [Candidatus Haliotispira prima]|uniref:Transmembrane protein n=1 Tax=Candidatus Haliotispira prima TaxID=3034016 RepID=A0ABY8MJR0_9SPIO|nr:hypothetical protein P0082_05240 [Candidatus Haliotispira prima]